MLHIDLPTRVVGDLAYQRNYLWGPVEKRRSYFRALVAARIQAGDMGDTSVEYGLPRAIRIDNGVPFATQAIHGLSYLNVWWMRLGIQQQCIQPGCPQQNCAHERMHRSLKRQAIRPVQRTVRCDAGVSRSSHSCERTRPGR